MSDNLSAQTSAIFEKLYDERGQPDELDDAFIQEYFKLVKDHVNLGAGETGPFTDVKLFGRDSGLVEVIIPREEKKFVASKLEAGKY